MCGHQYLAGSLHHAALIFARFHHPVQSRLRFINGGRIMPVFTAQVAWQKKLKRRGSSRWSDKKLAKNNARQCRKLSGVIILKYEIKNPAIARQNCWAI
jgi:hypothetical protein